MEFQLTFKIIIIVGVLIAVYATLRNLDVIKIILPTITDLVVAAVTYPVVISNGEIGADRTS